MDYETWKKENWDLAHQTADKSALTGTSLEGHLEALGAGNLLGSDTSLLCIGVGLGDWVREASEIAKPVWALDISPMAAASVPASVNFTTSLDALPENYFDLALSLWVAPHMSNHDLEAQIRAVVRSLKPAGTFALHYKEPWSDESLIDNREGAEDEWLTAFSAGMLRRRGHLDDMILWNGGVAVGRPCIYPSRFHGIVEVAVHIRKGM